MLTEFSNSSSTLYDTGMLAHQGGWDEILLVAGPILFIVLVLWRATRRAEKIAASREAQAVSTSETSPTPGE
jgi:hypothetical protein